MKVNNIRIFAFYLFLIIALISFRFNSSFGSSVDTATYRRTFTKVKDKVQELGRKSTLKKNELLACFSSKNWNALSENLKEKHSVYECPACLKDDSLRYCLGLFSINKSDLKGKKRATDGGLFRLGKEAVQHETSKIVTNLNSEYRKNYGTTFDCQYRICKGQKTKSEVKKCSIRSS